MLTFHDITTDQLRQMIHLRERIVFLQEMLHKLRDNAPTSPKRKVGRPAGKRTMSAATIEKMRTAQQARWAKIKGKPASRTIAPTTSVSKKKMMSPEAKAKIALAMKARWAAKKKGSSTPE